MRKKTTTKLIAFMAISTLMVSFCVTPVPVANAGTLTTLKDTLNRLKAAETSGITHKLIFTAATTIPTGINTLTIVAPDADDGLWCHAAEVVIATGCTDESSTALPGTLTAACTAGVGVGTYDTITISAITSLTGAVKYCVDIDDTGAGELGTPAAGSHTMTITTVDDSVGTDTGDAIIEIIADDQVAVTAGVNATLSFAITGDNTIGFGTLDSGAIRYATTDSGSASEVSAHTLTVGTNSTSGYSITVEGNTLKDGTPEITIIGGTETALAFGGEQFGIRISSTGGTCDNAEVAPYNHATSYAYDAVSAADQIVSCGSASGTTTFSIYYGANIAANTEAGNYTAALTYIATGNF